LHYSICFDDEEKVAVRCATPVPYQKVGLRVPPPPAPAPHNITLYLMVEVRSIASL